MNKRPLSLFTLLGLFLALQACSSNVLYQDDFSDHNSGWDQGEELGVGITSYAEGQYHIYINKINHDAWATAGQHFGDVRIEVDALPQNDDREDVYGVICRHQDDDNFYFFYVGGDGMFGIGITQGGQQSLLGAEFMEFSEAIHPGQAANHIRVDCVGNALSLYVNGSLLLTVNDTTFSAGDVGLIAGSFNQPNADIYFDNFIVYRP